MNLPHQPARRTLRYPLHLPVSIRLGNREIHARSENISLGGILLSSDFLIPEGSLVELAIGVARLPEHGMMLTAKGKGLRIEPTESGSFVVAIECDRSFKLMNHGS